MTLEERVAELEDHVYKLRERLAVWESSSVVYFRAPKSWHLTGEPARMLKILNECGCMRSKDLYDAMYGGRVNPPLYATMRSTLRELRRQVRPHGIDIVSSYRLGIEIPEPVRKRLIALEKASGG